MNLPPKTVAVVLPYQPQTFHTPGRILLPARFSAAAVLLLLLVTVALIFVFAQPQQLAKQATVPASAIARAEAAPVTVPAAVADPRLDEVAAMMPAAATTTLPSSATPADKTSDRPVKSQTINLSVKSKPKAQPAPPETQLETLTAQGIALGRQGDYVAAEQALRAALAIDRTNPIILYNLAVLADRRGDADSAQTLYEATLRQAAERPDTTLQPDLVTSRLGALDAQTAQKARDEW